MTATKNLLKRLPNDIGGSPADRIERIEHELEPLGEALPRAGGRPGLSQDHQYRGKAPRCRGAGRRNGRQAHLLRALDSSLRQHTVSEQILTPEALARKMDEVAQRHLGPPTG